MEIARTDNDVRSLNQERKEVYIHGTELSSQCGDGILPSPTEFNKVRLNTEDKINDRIDESSMKANEHRIE